jgi:Ca-activated chloride channel family protein
MRLGHWFPALAAAGLIAATASAQGLLIPTENTLPPLAIRSHKVTVDIEAQTAVTKVEQVFENNTERQLEARFLFPVPRGATLTKFTMLVNGVEKPGEIVEKNQARAIYNQIVSRSQDPGLLEYVGQDLIRANIFPIEPHSTQKITVTYSAVAPREGDLVGYTYPLRTGDKRGAAVRDAFGLTVRIKSPVAIKTVYSPSHSIVVSRASETEAEVAFEQTGATLDKDFQLYYGVSEKDVGLNLVTYRPDKAKPGYFLMLVSPRSKLQAERIVARDMVFVMDNSGSMAGDKIRQARDALKYCVRNLNEGDRFDIIKFSTDVEPWKNKVVPADAAGREAALKFIDTIEAEGGTNIHGALTAALQYKRQADRPFVIVFFTDGKPTLGDTTDPGAILKGVKASLAGDAAKNVRMFTWGVGYDLDTHLLDQLAESAGGVAEYVKPQEDIAAKVAAFYEKASRPMLTDVKLEVLNPKITVVDMYPKRLPDLYAGGQLVIFGRYDGAGDAALKLTGSVNGQAEAFTYETAFPAEQAGHGFIEPLWAKRRIGHLLDTIRLHGESKELVDDVIRLSKEYGIQTPYTSYLILEDGMQIPIDRPGRPVANVPLAGGGAGFGRARGGEERDAAGLKQQAELQKRLEELRAAGAPAPAPEPKSGQAGDPKAPPAAAKPGETVPSDDAAGDNRRKEKEEAARELAEGFAKKDGKAAVGFAKYLGDLKNADRSGETVAAVRKVGAVRFHAYRGLWVDERFTPETAVTAVKFGSDAYFALLDKHPALTDTFRLGTALIVVTAPGKAVMVSAAGEEKLTDARITDLFTAASGK